jgi:purine-binding chemotaxis protein CheW
METEATNVKDSSNEMLQLVTFQIGDENFAVDILNIQGINRMVEVTKVPNAPEFVEGIINLRGSVMPIVDLRKRLNLVQKPHDKDTRFIVIESGKRVIGFIVDRVNEVLRINKSVTEPPPPMVAGVDSEYITAVGKLDDRLLILLDIEKLLTYTELKKLSEIVEDNNN